MKKTFLLLFLTLFLLHCKQQDPVAKDATIKKEVQAVVNNWHLAATDANFENYFSKMDSTAIFIGTDASENWTKKQFSNFSKPYFDKGKAWDFKTIERNIYISKNKDVVWFDELLDTWMGTCRGSGVLEKSNTQWKIKQYVLSVTIPNDSIQIVRREVPRSGRIINCLISL